MKVSEKIAFAGGGGAKCLLENDGVPTTGENNGATPVCPRISRPPKEDGTTGAYSWSVSPLASKGFGVGTSILSYTYLFQLP